MSDPTHIEELRKEIGSLCGNCDRPDKEQLGEIILSSMALGFSYGINADRPQGEWIDIGTFSHSYKCSVCGRTLFHVTVGKNHVAKYYPYCHCGAKMKGADDDSYYKHD